MAVTTDTPSVLTRTQIPDNSVPFIRTFGHLPDAVEQDLQRLLNTSEGLVVERSEKARSSKPFPKSTDLELALKPPLTDVGFLHHHDLRHPKTNDRFEYDFWRADDGVAIEVMGYRADDEIYKDLLKFHVHQGTKVGVVWVPRWKWISNRRTETNFTATMKALAFADSFMNIDDLVAVVYDWENTVGKGWKLRIVE